MATAPSALERAWLAGLVEGEGCFQGRGRAQLAVTLAMTDEDVIRAAQDVTKLGQVTGPYKKSGKKLQWHWHVSQAHEAAALMLWLYPYLKSRRQAKVRELIEPWLELKDFGWGSHLRLMTHCHRGHPFSGDNLKIHRWNGKERRVCVACRKLRTAKQRERKKVNSWAS